MYTAQPNSIKKIINKGYTLIELLVVMLIIIVVFGVGTASYRNFQRRQLIEAKVRDVVADIKLIQQYALSGRVDICNTGTHGYFRGYTISSDNSESFYRLNLICHDSPNYEQIELKTVNMLPLFNVQVRGNVGGDRDILFEPLSQGTDLSPACVFLKDANGTILRRIRIISTGIITVDTNTVCN